MPTTLQRPNLATGHQSPPRANQDARERSHLQVAVWPWDACSKLHCLHHTGNPRSVSGKSRYKSVKVGKRNVVSAVFLFSSAKAYDVSRWQLPQENTSSAVCFMNLNFVADANKHENIIHHITMHQNDHTYVYMYYIIYSSILYYIYI